MAERPHDNCYWVIPGRFLASEYPTARYMEPVVDRLQDYLEHGVDTFVDLTEPHELDHYAEQLAVLGKHMGLDTSHHRMSIVDRSIPGNREQMIRILDLIDDGLAEGRNVCVHCWGGVGRTGLVVGCHLVRHGLSGEAALERIAGWWTQMEKRHRLPRSPETDEQRAYVLGWREPGPPRELPGS